MATFLDKIERIGNKIPNPGLLFFWLCLFIILLSALSSFLNLSGVNPISKEAIFSKSLISGEGLRFIASSMVSNFTQFAPVGKVLVAMLGLGIAEKSGLLDYWLMRVVQIASDKWLTFIVALAGILSSMAADSGYVILIPLSALIFKSAGRPAVAGVATAFAGVSGGFGANLLIGPFDVILAGISTEALNLVEPTSEVSITSNWYFAAFSSFLLAGIICCITHIRYGNKKEPTINDTQLRQPRPKETKDTRFIALASVIYLTMLGVLALPENAPLRDPNTGALDTSPFIRSIVIFIAGYFAIVGIVFGRRNGTFKNTSDIIKAMEESMASMGGYLVLMFFAAQFVAYFNWSQLGLLIALNGAGLLQSIELPATLLLVLFIFITGFVNLFIGSGSAKWSLLAPVFIPLFTLLSIPAEETQMAFRIGDSSSNIISPMMPYFALALSFLQRYDPKTGVGTLIAAMLPYSIGILILWSAVFVIWLCLGIPLGI